jgi:hypothetical protein
MPDLLAAPAERCPRCCGEEPVEASLVKQRGDRIVGGYECPNPRCGHRWATCWNAGILDEPAEVGRG